MQHLMYLIKGEITQTGSWLHKVFFVVKSGNGSGIALIWVGLYSLVLHIRFCQIQRQRNSSLQGKSWQLSNLSRPDKGLHMAS